MIQGKQLKVIKYQGVGDEDSLVLREKARHCAAPEGKETKQFANDLLVTMYASKGIGLAAPQVGVGIRVFAMDIEGSGLNCKVFANPVLLKGTGYIKINEGCLSFPGIFVEKERFKLIKIRAFDVLAGKQVTYKARGLEAACIQHEMEHLDGVLFIDGDADDNREQQTG